MERQRPFLPEELFHSPPIAVPGDGVYEVYLQMSDENRRKTQEQLLEEIPEDISGPLKTMA